MEEAVEGFLVAGHALRRRCAGSSRRSRGRTCRRPICAEKATPCFLRGSDEAVAQRPGLRGQRLVEARRLDQLQRRQTGGHRQRIARQRAGLIDRAERRDLFHDLAPAAEGAERHAAADHLAEGGQVRRDAVTGPARTCRPTRKPVITSSKISTAPCLVHSSRIALQELGRRRDQVHVAGHRLDDDRGDARRRVRRRRRASCCGIVVVEHQRVLRQVGRHAAEDWDCRRSARPSRP